jgi:hypothetical protein
LREREREREEKISGEVVRETLHFGEFKKERTYISGFEGSQAVPARPSGAFLMTDFVPYSISARTT